MAGDGGGQGEAKGKGGQLAAQYEMFVCVRHLVGKSTCSNAHVMPGPARTRIIIPCWMGLAELPFRGAAAQGVPGPATAAVGQALKWVDNQCCSSRPPSHTCVPACMCMQVSEHALGYPFTWMAVERLTSSSCCLRSAVHTWRAAGWAGGSAGWLRAQHAHMRACARVPGRREMGGGRVGRPLAACRVCWLQWHIRQPQTRHPLTSM